MEEKAKQKDPTLLVKIMKTSSKGGLTDLPESVIAHIISFMPIKDAVKLCSLSRQWDSLWTSTPNLLFHCDSPHLPDYKYRFAEFVDTILKRCTSSKINKFSLEFRPDLNSSKMMDQFRSWMDYAKIHEVEELCLNFKCPSGCLFKFTLFRIYKNFRWTSLKILCLVKTMVGDDKIRMILEECPLLKSLTLRECELFDNYNGGICRIDTTHHESMKKLVICDSGNFYDFTRRGRIEIKGPNLAWLSVVGIVGITMLKLDNVPSLVEANIGFEMHSKSAPLGLSVGEKQVLFKHREMVKDLLSELSHVKKLIVGTWCLQVLSVMKMDGETIGTSSRKILKINMNMDRHYYPGIALLLQSSPRLERLIIDVTPLDRAKFNLANLFKNEALARNYLTENKMEVECLNRQLRRVKITNYVSSRSEDKTILMELVQFVLGKSKVLQKLKIQEEAEQMSLCQFTRQDLLRYPKASPNAIIVFNN